MHKVRAFFAGLGMLVWLYVFGSIYTVIQRIIATGPRVARSPFGHHVRIGWATVSRCTAAWFYIAYCHHLLGAAVAMLLGVAVLLGLSASFVLLFSDQLDKPRMRQFMAWTAAFAFIGNLYWIASSVVPSSWYYTSAGVGTVFSAGCFLALYLVWRLIESQPQRDPGVEFAPLR